MNAERIRHALLCGLGWLALTGPAGAQVAGGCNCFPPEVQEKTAREALDKARLAVYGRVVEVDAATGRALLRVLESFKGPANDALVPLLPATAACLASSVRVGDERLLLAFDEPTSACDTHPPEHYLLAAFRALR
ncbi:hypothetical protein [Piscinibacter gummiphilus]|uniref:Lipoprotein n=1 Tax=Piscinibacter gummiphilus TaxID=946333 RepID=A0ABZ0CUX7_9BURK|nr:hypothetical protein [Piscinibacter gummiphilus]WOB08777.1 hypothetical protein RXV79_01670 [Piscinibacter gummiphilus]